MNALRSLTHGTRLAHTHLTRRTFASTASVMSKPLQLYTAATPNGQKVSVFLEELKQAYGKGFPGVEVHAVDIMSKDEPQKQPDFLKINPNGASAVHARDV